MKRLQAVLSAVAIALCATLAPAQGDRSETPIAPGISYLRLVRPGPMVVHVLRATLAEPTLKVGVAMAGKQVLGAETLPDLGRRLAAQQTVAGALNGGPALRRTDAFQGLPIGLVVSESELLCDPWPTQRSALLIGPEGRPRIEVLSVRGRVAGADGRLQRLAGLNRRRLPGEMVLYTPRFDLSTRVLEAGHQVVLSGVFAEGSKLTVGQSFRGRVEAIVDGRVNVQIPKDGAVIAGSGPAANWLAGRKLGEEVRFEFEYVPSVGQVVAALGAGPRLVRDGEVSIEAEQEKLGISRNTGRQPRSAVGYNERSLFLVAVDGRNLEYSLGADLEQLARLMVELGCTQAMELDGGGATSMVAKGRLVNQPSDGAARPLANAIVLLTSGPLSDKPLPAPTLNAEGTTPGSEGDRPPDKPVTPDKPGLPDKPVAPDKPGVPVPPAASGVARLRLVPDEFSSVPGAVTQLQVVGETADGKPATVDLAQVRFEVMPPALGTVDVQARFTAGKAAIGRITARLGSLSATAVVKVSRVGAPDLPPTPGPSTTPPAGPPSGPKPTVPGAPSGPPAAGPDVPPSVTPVPGGTEDRQPPQLPEGERRLIDGFEQADNWKSKVYPADAPGGFSIVTKNIRLQGDSCGELKYDFSVGPQLRCAYAIYDKVIGFPKAVSVFVFGDGKGHTLKGQLRDKTGKRFNVEFTRSVNWNHQWRRVSAIIPAEAKGPITWEAFYLVQTQPDVRTAGVIYLDQFEGLY